MFTHKYENLSEKFLIKTFNYEKQFCHLYSHRLNEMFEPLRRRAIERWGSRLPIRKLCDLREDMAEHCVIIGTIYKHQPFKPSILKEISEQNQLAPQPPRLYYSDPDDKIVLEDELQRVRLHGKIKGDQLATGIVCAARGSIEEDGRFYVRELLFCESGIQRPLKIISTDEPLLILVSGLDFVQSHNYVDSLNILQYWLRGNLLGKGKSKNTRLIIAGNSVRTIAEEIDVFVQTKKKDSQETINAVKELDIWFSSWSSSLAIDVMPGPYDPANSMLPQQPFNRCMFPLASRHSNFQSVSNPYACAISDCLVVGTAGQNIKDITHCTAIENSLDALRFTLQCGHMTPTAPDTLSCYPYMNADPFIIKECPHIYFAGNCNEFSSSLHEDSMRQTTLLVCVPSFSITQSVAVVNLETLECLEISFNCNEVD